MTTHRHFLVPGRLRLRSIRGTSRRRHVHSRESTSPSEVSLCSSALTLPLAIHPLDAHSQNNSQLGFFFFKKEDAEAIVDKVSSRNGRPQAQDALVMACRPKGLRGTGFTV